MLAMTSRMIKGLLAADPELIHAQDQDGSSPLH